MDLLSTQAALTTWFSALVAGVYRKHQQHYPADRLDYETLAQFRPFQGQPIALLLCVEMFDRAMTHKSESADLQRYTNEELLAIVIDTGMKYLVDDCYINTDILLMDQPSKTMSWDGVVSLWKTDNFSMRPDVANALTLLELLLPALDDGYSTILIAQLFALTLKTQTTDNLKEFENFIRRVLLILGRNPFLFDALHQSLQMTRLRLFMLNNEDVFIYIIELMTTGLCFAIENETRVEDLMPMINITVLPLIQARAEHLPFDISSLSPIEGFSAIIEFNALSRYPVFQGLNGDYLARYFQNPAVGGSLVALLSILSRERVFTLAELKEEEMKFGVLALIDEFVAAQGGQSIDDAVTKVIAYLNECYREEVIYSLDFDHNPGLRNFRDFRGLILSSLHQVILSTFEADKIPRDDAIISSINEKLSAFTDKQLLLLLSISEIILDHNAGEKTALVHFIASNINIASLFKSIATTFGEHVLLNRLTIDDFSCLIAASKFLTPEAFSQILETPSERAKLTYRLMREIVYTSVKSGRLNLDDENLIAFVKEVGLDIGAIEQEVSQPAQLRRCLSRSMFNLFAEKIESPEFTFADDQFSSSPF